MNNIVPLKVYYILRPCEKYLRHFRRRTISTATPGVCICISTQLVWSVSSTVRLSYAGGGPNGRINSITLILDLRLSVFGYRPYIYSSDAQQFCLFFLIVKHVISAAQKLNNTFKCFCKFSYLVGLHIGYYLWKHSTLHRVLHTLFWITGSFCVNFNDDHNIELILITNRHTW